MRRAKARSFSGCESHPATFAPAGSGDRGGNEAVKAFGIEGSVKGPGEHGGRNVSER